MNLLAGELRRIAAVKQAWRSTPEADTLKPQLEAAARVALAKSERITVRLTPLDLRAIKHKAAQEGLPYQTLIASLIHKYVTGQLVTRP